MHPGRKPRVRIDIFSAARAIRNRTAIHHAKYAQHKWHFSCRFHQHLWASHFRGSSTASLQHQISKLPRRFYQSIKSDFYDHSNKQHLHSHPRSGLLTPRMELSRCLRKWAFKKGTYSQPWHTMRQQHDREKLHQVQNLSISLSIYDKAITHILKILVLSKLQMQINVNNPFSP